MATAEPIGRNIEAIVEELRYGLGRQHKATLLIGAGCSVSAGIPLAGGFVELIHEHFPDAYRRAETKTYSSCMAELHRGLRHRLIGEQIDAAQINWAHVAIAQLMSEGYVDRVLTTNFDPLVVRACALIGQHPAVYDFALSQLLKPAQVPDNAVFHLHGQRAGFVTLHTEEECRQHAERLGPLFQDAGRGRSWIVVGYSGESDPVFELLSKVSEFEFGLYWVGYKDAEPAPHVVENLLISDKGAYLVRGYDADGFFVELAQRLGCFPPPFIEKPFSFLKASLDSLAPFSPPSVTPIHDMVRHSREVATHDVLKKPKKIIEEAILRFEQEDDALRGAVDGESGALEQTLNSMLMAGRYQALQDFARHMKEIPEVLRDPLAVAYVLDADALSAQATVKSGAEADRLFAHAGEKYQAALAIKPDYYQALNNWGNALQGQAEPKSGAEADRLFALASERYQAALATKPDSSEVLNNWGVALQAQAKTKSGVEADRLLTQAGEKFEAALTIKPNSREALNNWGNVLVAQAKARSDAEADRLLVQACERFESALATKPDDPDVLTNWGIALSRRAEAKSDAEADRLFAQAVNKYQEALTIRPDLYAALTNWGSASLRQAVRESGKERKRLLDLAVEKTSQALKGGYNEALYNLACAEVMQGDYEAAKRHLLAAKEHNVLPATAHLEHDPDLAGLRDELWFRDFLANL
jgi:Tfp pilus assembly protein PilF